MAAGKRVRWECPHGLHPGVLGASKPRKDSIVRYCLPCSEKAGRLVERVAPAVERKREQQRERTQARAKTKAQRDRERETARFTVCGIDLRREMARLSRLPAFGGTNGSLVRWPVTLEVRRCGSMPGTLGRAWPHEHRISVSAYPGQDSADVRETLLHELAHVYLGNDPRDRATWHGSAFQAKMREAFEEAYGCRPFGAYENRYHGGFSRALRWHEMSPAEKRAKAEKFEAVATRSRADAVTVGTDIGRRQLERQAGEYETDAAKLRELADGQEQRVAASERRRS